MKKQEIIKKLRKHFPSLIFNILYEDDFVFLYYRDIDEYLKSSNKEIKFSIHDFCEEQSLFDEQELDDLVVVYDYNKHCVESKIVLEEIGTDLKVEVTIERENVVTKPIKKLEANKVYLNDFIDRLDKTNFNNLQKSISVDNNLNDTLCVSKHTYGINIA